MDTRIAIAIGLVVCRYDNDCFIFHDDASAEAGGLFDGWTRTSILGVGGNHYWHVYWHRRHHRRIGTCYQHGWAGCAYPIGLGLGTVITGLCFCRNAALQIHDAYRRKWLATTTETASSRNFSASRCSFRNCAGSRCKSWETLPSWAS